MSPPFDKMSSMEIRKEINWYGRNYKISSIWNVRNVLTNKILKQMDNGLWYLYVFLWKKWKSKHYYIHRLIAEAFIPNTKRKYAVNHKDWNKSNNRIENLERVTRSENELHAHKTGLKKPLNYRKWKFWKDHKTSKKVWQYTLEWSLVKVRSNSREISRELWFDYRGISAVCVWRRFKAFGFKRAFV